MSAKGTKYVLRLFVAGDEPNSRAARENLDRICQKHLPGRHEIEVVDVLQDFEAALQESVFVTPMLLVPEPPPRTSVLGSLNDECKVLKALRLAEEP